MITFCFVLIVALAIESVVRHLRKSRCKVSFARKVAHPDPHLVGLDYRSIIRYRQVVGHPDVISRSRSDPELKKQEIGTVMNGIEA